MVQTWNILNRFNLGDQLFNMFFFSQIWEYISYNDIFINYACKEEYFPQIAQFIQPEYRDRINLVRWRPHQDHVYQDYFLLWIGNKDHFVNNAFSCGKSKGFNVFLTDFFNEYLEKHLHAPLRIKELVYIETPTGSDLLQRYNYLPESMQNVDILFINSRPLSGQFRYNVEEWNSYIEKAAERWKVVTTMKVYGHIPCTLDYMMTVKTIAAIASHAKYIIAINTGPMAACMTEMTFKNVKMIYIFDDNNSFDHEKITQMTSISDIVLSS
jgi:hypothetical protein